jgi:hypothetical protein
VTAGKWYRPAFFERRSAAQEAQRIAMKDDCDPSDTG